MLTEIQPLALREHPLPKVDWPHCGYFSHDHRSSGSLARWVYSLGLVLMPDLAYLARRRYLRPGIYFGRLSIQGRFQRGFMLPEQLQERLRHVVDALPFIVACKYHSEIILASAHPPPLSSSSG